MVRKVTIVLVGLACTVAPVPAQAQLGGIFKKAEDVFGRLPGVEQEAEPTVWNPPVDQGEKKRINKNYKKTIVQGAVIGGIIGGGLSAILGADAEIVALSTAGGAALGAAIGKDYADKFEKMAQSKKRTEKQIAALEANNAALVQSLDAIEENIAYIRTELAILKEQRKRNAITATQLASFRAEARKELQESEATLNKVNLTYAEAEQTLKSVQSSSDPEVTALASRAGDAVTELGETQARSDNIRKDVSSQLKEIGNA